MWHFTRVPFYWIVGWHGGGGVYCMSGTRGIGMCNRGKGYDKLVVLVDFESYFPVIGIV